MKMIDVLNLMAEGEIKNDTKLIVSNGLNDYEYRYMSTSSAAFVVVETPEEIIELIKQAEEI